MFNRILVANRGEIAIRVIRTCHEMGIQTVAVYSAADRTAPHVLMSDEAYFLGPAPASESYLDSAKILEIAAQSRAEAIHPGYGFLSENSAFAQKVIDRGLTWIGPPPNSIRDLGDKTVARRLAVKAGVPIIPGLNRPLTPADEAPKIAAGIGFPVLVKAAGGGGGKGMRIVHNPRELKSALSRASSEARSSFADDRIYIEKFLQGPRHIEIQILADRHGHCLALGERECSIQRRYQKIIEEAPSPFVGPELRAAMQTAAVNLARAAGYVGAGTVEFLVDRHRNYYFLEMNTRLQVEHPVTEMITGIDLVRQQLRIAWGDPLEFSPEDIKLQGHALECRIYAEDGFNDFTPSVGTIHELVLPDGFGVRLDHGMRVGEAVTPYYDPLLGKLIVRGSSRTGAIAGMRRALSEFHVVGIETIIPFCISVMENPRFQEGTYTTNFITEQLDALLGERSRNNLENRQVTAVAAILHEALSQPQIESPPATGSAWKLRGRNREPA